MKLLVELGADLNVSWMFWEAQTASIKRRERSSDSGCLWMSQMYDFSIGAETQPSYAPYSLLVATWHDFLLRQVRNGAGETPLILVCRRGHAEAAAVLRTVAT